MSVLTKHPIDPTSKFGEIINPQAQENKRCLAPLASWMKAWGFKIGTGEGEFAADQIPGTQTALYGEWSKLRIDLSEKEKKRYNARLDLLKWSKQTSTWKILATRYRQAIIFLAAVE